MQGHRFPLSLPQIKSYCMLTLGLRLLDTSAQDTQVAVTQ